MQPHRFNPMADIFVSYAKTDRSLASKLVAMLEAEGWSVWWDKTLGAADLYRDEIMKQLASARAVIAIWTPNSIRSDWVRAEAGTAKADGKLIPVKTADVLARFGMCRCDSRLRLAGNEGSRNRAICSSNFRDCRMVSCTSSNNRNVRKA